MMDINKNKKTNRKMAMFMMMIVKEPKTKAMVWGHVVQTINPLISAVAKCYWPWRIMEEKSANPDCFSGVHCNSWQFEWRQLWQTEYRQTAHVDPLWVVSVWQTSMTIGWGPNGTTVPAKSYQAKTCQSYSNFLGGRFQLVNRIFTTVMTM